MLKLFLIFVFAANCPATEGAAVYRARILCNIIDNTNYNYNGDCIVDEQYRKANFNKSTTTTADNNNDIIVYPNPATNQLTVSSGKYSVNRIEIKDILGRIFISMGSGELVEPHTANIINTTNLPSGLYFIEITNTATHEKTIKKITIQ
jgi:hypothetical protein